MTIAVTCTPALLGSAALALAAADRRTLHCSIRSEWHTPKANIDTDVLLLDKEELPLGKQPQWEGKGALTKGGLNGRPHAVEGSR